MPPGNIAEGGGNAKGKDCGLLNRGFDIFELPLQHPDESTCPDPNEV
jgi:hypothetical protein